MITGYELLRTPRLTKSTGFSPEERNAFGLRGLLPYKVTNLDEQKERVLENMRRKDNDIEKYIFLTSLQDRNDVLFYRTLIDHIEELMPLIYTPTVGQACREFAHIFRRPRGFYITPDDRGQIHTMLNNWPVDDVRAIVITDGERILGLGDLGANGMGIPIGKLALYIACAGIHPHQCMPVMLDVGTNNEALREDPLYLGYPHPRVSGDAYLDLVDEFVSAVQDKFPKALIQFEDFLTPNAYALLNRYRDKVLCFNDDIQGTAAVALAGVLAALRITEGKFTDQRIMFLGAGSAATGIGDLIAAALMKQGLSEADARARLWFVDVNGLVVRSRNDLMPHNIPYAHDHEQLGFLHAIDAVKPNILIGATGAPGTFTQDVVARMAKHNERPVIFALSNPTSRAECTAEQAYQWSDGRAIFSSGSPFAPVLYEDKIYKPGQGNNAYVFPGIGLGALGVQAKALPQEIFLAAADALSQTASDHDLSHGTLYPPLSTIRDVSLKIAEAVAEKAYELGLAQIERPNNLTEFLKAQMFDPHYTDYTKGDGPQRL